LAPSPGSLADFITPPATNRRLHRRAKVNYYAYVCSETFGDDIVPCIDMSRGGLSFKTKRPYARTSVVHIAVPFAREGPQAPAIFVTARVVYMPSIAGSELFRCGIALLPLR
jgi:hypothetical protein